MCKTIIIIIIINVYIARGTRHPSTYYSIYICADTFFAILIPIPTDVEQYARVWVAVDVWMDGNIIFNFVFHFFSVLHFAYLIGKSSAIIHKLYECAI